MHRWFLFGIFLCVWEVESVSKEISLRDVVSKLEGTFRSVAKQLLTQIYRVASRVNVSFSCQVSFLRVISGVNKADEWALKMLDASGKPPAGFLLGVASMFGDYDECLDIVGRNARQKVLFGGKYCMVKLSFIDSIFHQSNETIAGGFKVLLEEALIVTREIRRLAFHLGVCVPSTCEAQDVNQVVDIVTRDFGFQSRVACETKHVKEPNTEQLVFLCIFSTLAFMVFIGTVFDLIYQYSAIRMKSDELRKFLIAFSLFSNTNRLFRTIQRDNTLAAVRGCRVLSTLWIILAHVYYFLNISHFLKYRRLSNFVEFEADLTFTAIHRASLAIDTFFVMSGMLFVYTVWGRLEKNKGWINPVTYLTHRMVRIVLVEALVIALFMVLPLFGNGPIWNETFEDDYAACRDNWWTNLLFVQNFLSYERICLLHTWFLGAWFQIFSLTFGVIFILYRSQSLGICINVLLIVASCCVTGFLTLSYNLPSYVSGIENLNSVDDFSLIIHFRPYTHLSSYCVGILLGYAITIHRHRKINPWIQFTGWLLSVCGAVCVMYGPHFFNTGSNKTLDALYAALRRTTWSSAVAWMLFACSAGYGGMIGRLLSWKGMIPLDRASLFAYLIHPLVIYYHTARTRATIYLSHVEQTYLYVATVVITLILSTVFNVTYEQPLIYIEKLIIRKFSKTSDVVQGIKNLSPLPETIITLREPIPEENTSSKL